MKELTIEEKAKRYDEAIAIAMEINNEQRAQPFDVMTRVFPELKESEDERIRKEIIDYFQSDWAKEEGITRPDWIAWLKRIGKQKPADKVEPKFHVGEWVFIEEIKGFKNGPFQIKTVNSLGYSFDEYHIIPLMYEELLSKWTIQDAKDGDMIYVSTEVKGIQAIFYKYEGGIIYFHCNLCGDFIADGYMPIGTIEFVSPLQKVHYQRFFQKMKEAGYEWDANHKQLKKIEQKPAWSEEAQEEQVSEEFINALGTMLNDGLPDRYLVSEERIKKSAELLFSIARKQLKNEMQEWSEEDERNLNDIILFIKTGTYSLNKDNLINWLKSLRPQSQWKPSDEQINNK